MNLKIFAKNKRKRNQEKGEKLGLELGLAGRGNREQSHWAALRLVIELRCEFYKTCG